MKKLYVGCGLTHATQDFRNMVEWVKGELRKEWEVPDFLGLVKGTPRDVYRHDIHVCVARCDMFLAIWGSIGSDGLGYEAGTAVEKRGVPTLGVAHKDAAVSRLVIGIDHPLYTFERYDTPDQIISLVRIKAARHFQQHSLQLEMSLS